MINEEAYRLVEKSTQKQLIIKTATLLGVDVVLVGAGVNVQEDFPVQH
jgi:UDP-N-acetyl-D-mannosaminuronic acid transferase (WecB/TagA/CpsF family)